MSENLIYYFILILVFGFLSNNRKNISPISKEISLVVGRINLKLQKNRKNQGF